MVLDSRSAAQYAAALARLQPTFNNCATASIRRGDAALTVNTNTALGLLAEAWFKTQPAPSLVPTTYVPGTSAADWDNVEQAGLVVRRLATCLAATKPGLITPLMAASPGSGDEGTAFAALGPAIPSCLEGGVTLSTSRPSLRLALAAALYRRAYVPADDPAPEPVPGRGGGAETVFDYPLTGDILGYQTYARCVVAQDAAGARASLRDYLTNAGGYPMLALAGRSRACVPSRIARPNSDYLFVASVAEAVVRQEDPSLTRLDGFKLVVDVKHDPTLAFAACAIRNDPTAARAFLLSDVQSGAETSAARALMRRASSCPFTPANAVGRIGAPATRAYFRSKVALAAFVDTL